MYITGLGSIIPIIIGALAAISFGVKIYWTRIKDVFKRK